MAGHGDYVRLGRMFEVTMTTGGSHVLPSVGFDQADQVADLPCLLVYRRCVAVRYEAVEFAGWGVGDDLAVPAIIVDGLKAVERAAHRVQAEACPAGRRRGGGGQAKACRYRRGWASDGQFDFDLANLGGG